MPLQVNPESGRLLMLSSGALMNQCCCTSGPGPGPTPAPKDGLVVDDVFEVRESGCTFRVSSLCREQAQMYLCYTDGITRLEIQTYTERSYPDGETKPAFLCHWYGEGSLTFAGQTYTFANLPLWQREGLDWSNIGYHDPAYWFDQQGVSEFRLRAVYPVRMTADIHDYPRVTYDAQEWGPTANATDEVRDLRQYTDAHLAWAFLPSDIPAAGTPCGVTLEIYDSAIWRTVATVTSTGGGAAYWFGRMAITAGMMDNTGPGVHTATLYDIRELSQSPEMHPWGETYHETHPAYRHEPSASLIYSRAQDNSISIEITGDPATDGAGGIITDPWDPAATGGGINIPNVWLSFMGDPAYHFDVTADGRNLAGLNLPGGLITCQPYDGPQQWAADENPQQVMHVCPAFPGGTLIGYGDSPPITLTMPGQWQQTARSYVAQSGFVWPYGNIVHTWPVYEQGCAALGFVCNPSSLQAADYERNAWRLPIGLPLVGARWAAGEIALAAGHTIDDFTGGVDGWAAADANTTVAAVAGALRVTTTGATSSITKAPTAAEVDWTTGRYLVFEINTAGPVAGNTLTIGTKAWTFAAPGGTATVRLDLCAPTNRAGIPLWENRQALEFPVPGMESGWDWGITDNPILTFTFNTAATVTIDNIRLARAATEARHSSIVSEMIADLPTYLIDLTPYYQYGRRGLVHLVDGKVALDIHHGHMTINTDGTFGPVPYTIDSMLQTADDCNGKGLLTVTNLRPHGTPPFVRPDNHNQYFGDQSFYYAHQFCTNGQYGYQLIPTAYKWHEDSTEPVGLMAHLAADRISFGVGTACKPLTIRRMFGGGLAGVVADTTGALPGLLVDIRKGGTRRDSDTTDANGSYRTPRVARSLTKTGVFDITRAGGATPATLAFAEEGVLHRRSLP